MKTQSIALTIGTALSAFGLLLFFIQILSRKLKHVSETETAIKLSYAFHVGGILAAGSILLANALPLVPEGFGIQWATHQQSFVLDALKLVATIIGFSFVWIGAIYYLIQAMTSIILGKRQEKIEMERDNYSLFLIKALAIVALSIIATPVFEGFLRLFLPTLDTPFYH